MSAMEPLLRPPIGFAHRGARAHAPDNTLDAFRAHLSVFGVGSIAEIFDAEAPFAPRGCIAQAWSVAEILRARLRTL